MADWTEQYRPTTLSAIRGNDTARDELREWAETWDDHREAVVLHGSPGVGKTSAAHALAADMGWDAMELNASDSRTREDVERVAGGAAMNQSLATITYDRGDERDDEGGTDDSGRQLLILDEADNLHQHQDRGGAGAMTDLVKRAAQPVVLVANDYYEMSRGLRNACREIEFRDVSARSIVPVLRDICRKEGIEFEAAALEHIAEQNSGDLRGAIKDLQAAAEGRDSIVEADVATAERDRTEDIWAFLDAVLKEQSAEAALRTTYDVDETPDDLLQWVEDKAPKVYEGAELADAYDHLANADRWLGRVRATQDYSFWRYATDNLAAGVAAVRREPRGGWTRYGGAPYRSARDATRDYVARRVAERAGLSTATARREVLPYLAAMTHHCRNRELTVAMAARYELDAEHVAFVTGSGEDTNKVQSIVEEATERREAAVVDGAGNAFAPTAVEPGADADDGSDDTADADGDDASGTLADFEASTGGDGDEEGATRGESTDADGAPDDADGAPDDAVTDESDPDRAETAAEDDQQSGLSDFT